MAARPLSLAVRQRYPGQKNCEKQTERGPSRRPRVSPGKNSQGQDGPIPARLRAGQAPFAITSGSKDWKAARFPRGRRSGFAAIATWAILARSETARGKIQIQIRDFDQTVIGNPAHDLIRLSLSIASAARGSDLPGLTTVKMLERIMQDYHGAFAPVSTRAGTSKSRSRCGASRKRPPRRLGNRSPRRISKAQSQLFRSASAFGPSPGRRSATSKGSWRIKKCTASPPVCARATITKK